MILVPSPKNKGIKIRWVQYLNQRKRYLKYYDPELLYYNAAYYTILIN